MVIHTNVDEKKRDFLTPTYAMRDMTHSIPRHRIGDHAMSAREAYEIVHDQLMLDGNSRLNLATFVSTWMDDEARKLMNESFDKNMIDKDEYPQTALIEERCVRIIADLFHAPGKKAVGVSTVGSSEAVMLAGLAMKWRWRDRRRRRGLAVDKPNLVLGSNVQVVWEKFCRYWDIEPRYLPLKKGRYVIAPKDIIRHVDDNTIGVCAILGTTFTGHYEPIADINDILVDLARRKNLHIPLHVDAASGGFVAPFLQPELKWDFRLPSVCSINVSGHKYGLVFPGVGWCIWRERDYLPEDLIFHVNYLGGDMPTFTLNFSRPGSQVIAQYYNFLRLGREGYTQIMIALRDTAVYLARQIKNIGVFDMLSDGEDIPVLAFSLKPDHSYTVFDISRKLRERGWTVPAYTMPADITDMAVLRIVVREGFSHDMADMLIRDMTAAIAYFEEHPVFMTPVKHRHKAPRHTRIC